MYIYINSKGHTQGSRAIARQQVKMNERLPCCRGCMGIEMERLMNISPGNACFFGRPEIRAHRVLAPPVVCLIFLPTHPLPLPSFVFCFVLSIFFFFSLLCVCVCVCVCVCEYVCVC